MATVDGHMYAVYPEETTKTNHTSPAISTPSAVATHAPVTSPVEAAVPVSNGVTAPIPGVIVSVAIKEGETVKSGQELCVLEAMKMKNVIRAARDGKIATVHVSAGVHVRQRQLLMEFTP